MDNPFSRSSPRSTCSWLVLATFFVVAIMGVSAYWFWPRAMNLSVREPNFVWTIDQQGHQSLIVPGRAILGVLGRYENELYAYLMFDFVRHRIAVSSRRILLVYITDGNKSEYWTMIVCPSNLLKCAPEAFQLSATGLGNAPSWGFFIPAAVGHFNDETRLFIQAYSGPVGDAFRKLSPRQHALYVSRFLRFKSATDYRVRGWNDANLHPLTQPEALRLAADIISVADFYSLPLAYFLGIGAMENNYLDVEGDRTHRIWKRHADPGDIIVRRGRRGVLVENPALGVWQITVETLRFAHALFLQDKRDYSKLPERLRPTRTLDIDHVTTGVLTTYAGLLLRHLLDQFNGNVAQAVGAYNGGPANPNQKYAAGVRRVAEYARRILDRAALLHETAIEQFRPSHEK